MDAQLGEELHTPHYSMKPPFQHVEGRRYWKFTTGVLGKFWGEMIRLQRVGVENAAAQPVYLDHLPREHDAFVEEISQNRGIVKPAAEYLWKFMHEVQLGDFALATQRNEVVGWGEITGGYEYGGDNELPVHQRQLAWSEFHPVPIHTLSQGFQDAIKIWDPAELTPEMFGEAMNMTTHEISTPDNHGRGLVRPKNFDMVQEVQRHLVAMGLRYTNAQVATFVTALQTKGFVVLSGISGTGKSKIATGFVEMLPEHANHSVPVGGLPSEKMPSFKMSTNQTWVAIGAEQSDLFPPIDLDDTQKVAIDFKGTTWSGSVILRILKAGKPTLYLTLGEELSSLLRDLGPDQRIYCRFDLNDSGIAVARVELFESPPAVTSVPTAFAEEVIRTTPNHLFLSVRPDWRDSTSLLGYYNPLTQTYEWTEFLTFIRRSVENYKGPEDQRIAWFVILDEMNLAHVEYYFADLLSVLESGRDEDGWTGEPLRTSYPAEMEERGEPVPPQEILLPPNLYIIGTVNMDETTHAFSPKVLDRAFTIELTEVDFRDYPPVPKAETSSAATEESKRALLAAFTRGPIFHRIDKKEIAAIVELYPQIRSHLQSLNHELQRDRFHFGYRVFDEIAQYLAVNDVTGLMDFDEAFDRAVFMKVLPKFSGSRARLRSPLLSVLAWALYPTTPHEMRAVVEKSMMDLLKEEQPDVDEFVRDASYPVVAARATRMLLTLETDGFVSFG